MLLKNLRPADDYDRFANEALAPWDALFIARIRELARALLPGTLADIGTATAVVPVRLAADPAMAQWRFVGVDLDPRCSTKACRASRGSVSPGASR